MTQHTVADFLTPAGFAPPPVTAVLREGHLVQEASRFAAHAFSARGQRRRIPYASRAPVRVGEPVLLVPGFLAGDASLRLMNSSLRQEGFRTYRSQMRANVSCTLAAAAQLEERLTQIAQHRGSRVQIVGHSLGGMLARGVAARRPDLVSGIITMGSPMMAPGAHHVSLSRSVGLLLRLSRAGMQGVMAEDCVAGQCARESFDRARTALSYDVRFTAVFSKRDGIVDWRACIDPIAHAVEVRASHVGMALDPEVISAVVRALRTPAPDARLGSALEVDRGDVA